MSIPFEPILFGYSLNIHLILEYAAFFIAFQYYLYLRRNSKDQISSSNRLSIILGAIIGALLGSRIVGFLENPLVSISLETIVQLWEVKTIMGGLFGGLLGVELAKKLVGEKESSGDLFTLPLILGIFIGRIGCFLMGIKEFTYGSETTFFMGMDLGDGLLRHPVALYDLLFLALLFMLLRKIRRKAMLENGQLFILFMLAYFGFRFFIEFLKPNVFYILGLSSIQWLSVICFIYYRKSIAKLLKNAS